MITARELRLLRICMANHDLSRRFSVHRIHKASSAESILKQCLRVTGHLKEWRRDTLSACHVLELIETIRTYGREWLRHDAEQFARHYLKTSRALSSTLAGHFRRFFGRTKQFVRELITAGSMALLGPAPLTGEDLDEIEKNVQVQHQFFDKFHDEIIQGGEPAPKPIIQPDQVTIPIAPPMSPDQFIARVEQYGNSGFTASQEIARARAIRERIFTEERRVHAGTDQPCDTCQSQLELNWQPIGTLLPIGASECRCHCHCSYRYRRPGDDREYIVPSRGKALPAMMPTADLLA